MTITRLSSQRPHQIALGTGQPALQSFTSRRYSFLILRDAFFRSLFSTLIATCSFVRLSHPANTKAKPPLPRGSANVNRPWQKVFGGLYHFCVGFCDRRTFDFFFVFDLLFLGLYMRLFYFNNCFES